MAQHNAFVLVQKLLCCLFTFHYVKMISPPSLFYAHYTKTTRLKQKLQTILQIYQSGIITFRHFTLYLDEALLEGNTASSLLEYDTMDFVGLNLGIFLVFLSADPLKLCQLGLGLCVNVHFHISA